MPVRAATMCGALVMDSMPPATTMLAEPALIRSCPSMIAFMPEPHTLLMVVQPVETGRPAPSAAWRAGAWPRFAGSTQPMKTSETSVGAIPDCCNAARMVVAPSVGVGTPVNWPRKEPIAVRLAPTITTESDIGNSGWIGELPDYAPDVAVRQRSRPDRIAAVRACPYDRAGEANHSSAGEQVVETFRRIQGGGRNGIVALLLLSLGACGGGGGNSNVRPSSTPPPPPPPPPSTPQPPLDAQLAITNTYAAHNAGYTGKGVTIGVVDSGIMRGNPTVAGRVLQELIYVDPTQNNTSVDDVVGHGTWVSEIAAGTSFGQFAGGIAPGANLVSARIISDNAPDDNGSTPPTTVTTTDAQFFQQVNTDLINSGVNVMNNSWEGITWDTSDTSVNQAFDAAYSPFINQHGGLVVLAAGNDSN